MRSPGVIYQMVSYLCFGELYTGPHNFLHGEVLLVTYVQTGSLSQTLTTAARLAFCYEPSCVDAFSPCVCVASECTGCYCLSCSHMHGRDRSPELERLKLLSLKMRSIMAPTSLSLCLCSSMWLLTHSGNSPGETGLLYFYSLENKGGQIPKKIKLHYNKCLHYLSL